MLWLSNPKAGGSLGFADPTHGLGFGYTMNKMAGGALGDPRTCRIIEALYSALGQPIKYRRDENGLPVPGGLMSQNNGNLGGGPAIPARL